MPVKDKHSSNPPPFLKGVGGGIDFLKIGQKGRDSIFLIRGRIVKRGGMVQ